MLSKQRKCGTFGIFVQDLISFDEVVVPLNRFSQGHLITQGIMADYLFN